MTHRGGTTSLFSFLYNPDGQTTGLGAAVCIGGRSMAAGFSLLDAVEAVTPWPWVRPRLVLADPMVDRAGVPVLSDLNGKAHGAYVLEGISTLMLVRPDGHIACRFEADRTNQLTAYCRKTFGAAVVTGMLPSNGSVEEATV